MRLAFKWATVKGSALLLQGLSLAHGSATMPKVPVTSKRAIRVLSAEPLVPPAVHQALEAAGRRSTRSAVAAAQLTAAQTAEPPDADEQQPKAYKKGKGQTAKQSRGSAAAVQANGSGAHKATEPRSKTVEENTSRKQERPKKRRRKLEVKAEDTAAGDVKVKQEAIRSVDNLMATDEAAVAAAAEAAVPGKLGKPKSNRRAPAGFALRGEDVDDSLAARRARLKAVARGGPETEPGEVPRVLGDEIRRMCDELGSPDLGLTAPWECAAGAVGGRKWWVGCHVSTSGGMERAVVNAAAIGCRAFALDTRCKMRWESPPLTDETVAAFKDACKRFGFGPEQILPHGSYLINLASPNPEMANKGYGGFLTELQRCEKLGLTLYNFHPGSTTGLCTHEESMDRIADFINRALAATKGVTVVLENMASVGNIVGGRLWHLRYIIDRIEDKSRIGVCIDTCHLFSSGKDLRTVEACEETFKEIDDVVGLKYLRGLHVNDSKTPFDSHRDRHENIGRGSIPLTAFRWIMNNPAFQGIPLIMETPVQEREPPINYKKSIEAGNVVWRDPDGPYGVGTDRRDIIVLNSLASG